jgi:hypothetical protein
MKWSSTDAGVAKQTLHVKAITWSTEIKEMRPNPWIR